MMMTRREGLRKASFLLKPPVCRLNQTTIMLAIEAAHQRPGIDEMLPKRVMRSGAVRGRSATPLCPVAAGEHIAPFSPRLALMDKIGDGFLAWKAYRCIEHCYLHSSSPGMVPAVLRLRLLAPLLLIAVLIYLLYDIHVGTRRQVEALGPVSQPSAPVHPHSAPVPQHAPEHEASIPVASILDLITSSVNASIDRYDPVAAHQQMNFNLDRTYSQGYEKRLRQIHHEFFDTDEEMLATALGHLSRLPRRTEAMARNIFMTGTEERDGIPEECQSWTSLNPDWAARYLSDAQIDDWLEATFPPTAEGQAGVVREMKLLRGKRGIIRSDLFRWGLGIVVGYVSADGRYLALLLEGGVYSDTDTACIKPIDEWARDPEVRYAHPIEAHLPALLARAHPSTGQYSFTASSHEPSLVVAVEMDAHGIDWDWRGYKFAREIQIVQWTIMGSKGHPVFLDVLGYTLRQARSIREAEERGDIFNEPRVLDWSGPGAFTDALMRYLLVRHGVHPTDLAGLNKARRYGDVVILPMHAFRAEASDRDMGDGRVVFHGFYGRWKSDDDWDVVPNREKEG